MRKWPLFVTLGFSTLGLCVSAFAVDNNTLPVGGALVCMPLIQNGNAIPPVTTTHLDTLKFCMNNCDSLFQTLGDQGHTDAMLRSTNDCRRSLSNLYYASVSQVITDQLNQQTKQQQATDQQSIFERVSAAMAIKQHAQDQEETPHTANTSPASAPASVPTNPPPVAGPSDNINW
jgi:hypothetical protein